MIKSYQEYLNKIDALKIERENIVKDVQIKLTDDLETEFKKSLKIFVANQAILANVYEKNAKIFLIDDDYGIRFRIEYNDYFNILSVYVYTIYEKDGKWIQSKGNLAYYKTNDEEDVEYFVKKAVEKLKKRNISRKKEKETRDLNRAMKKYNV